MTAWANDGELLTMMRTKLFSAVIGDILDEMGFYHQFLPPHITPLDPKMVLAGRALTVLQADIPEDEAGQGNPFGLMFTALDDLKTGEVYFVAGGSPHYSLWGELMSMRAQRLGAAGAVMDGPARDTAGIIALDFPVFSRGSYAQDQRPRGRVIDFRCPVHIGKVRIDPGDLVFGDRDGTLVIPRAAEEEALRRAVEKVETENAIRIAIEGGISATEAFEKFGVM
jgi:regulator of RNase E activity RraA